MNSKLRILYPRIYDFFNLKSTDIPSTVLVHGATFTLLQDRVIITDPTGYAFRPFPINDSITDIVIGVNAIMRNQSYMIYGERYMVHIDPINLAVVILPQANKPGTFQTPLDLCLEEYDLRHMVEVLRRIKANLALYEKRLDRISVKYYIKSGKKFIESNTFTGLVVNDHTYAVPEFDGFTTKHQRPSNNYDEMARLLSNYISSVEFNTTS